MSLYDDLTDKKEEGLGWQSQTEQIRLLHQHLSVRRQTKREPKRVAPLPRPKPPTEELKAPPLTQVALSYHKGSLLGGDWDLGDEYDPLWPNDYEALKTNLKQEKKKDLVPEYNEPEPIKEKVEERRGATIAPPPSLLAEEPSSVAQKIMKKMGYREGQGLGKEEQGIPAALQVEKTGARHGKIVREENDSQEASVVELLKRPSKVVLLRNMVGKGQVDDELEAEVSEECLKYGEVVSCHVIEDQTKEDEEAVRIFVEFSRVEAAVKAVVDLNGRFFGGRSVKAAFFDWEKFKRKDLS